MAAELTMRMCLLEILKVSEELKVAFDQQDTIDGVVTDRLIRRFEGASTDAIQFRDAGSAESGATQSFGVKGKEQLHI